MLSLLNKRNAYYQQFFLQIYYGKVMFMSADNGCVHTHTQT